LDGESESLADDRDDVADGITFVGHCMPGGPGRGRLQGEPEEDGRIEGVHGRPSLLAVARVAGDTGLARDRRQHAGESTFAFVVDCARQAHRGGPDSAGREIQGRQHRATTAADKALGRRRIGFGGGPAGHVRRTGNRYEGAIAADELFAEQGYDATTVAQIAERAGVTRSTFFRHFPDKRELLVAGQDALSRLLAEGIAEAPPEAGPLEAVAAGLSRASSAFGPMNHEIGPRLKAAVAASTELQERDILKSVGLAATMTAALVARGVPDPIAQLAGELGILAFKRGYAEWSEADSADEFAPYALNALAELRAATASLG
jgi:AcrR family transcriptional regulator